MSFNPSYKIFKTRLKKVLLEENEVSTYKIINDVVIRCHEINYRTRLLLRLWLITKYNMNQELPVINKDTIKVIRRVVMRQEYIKSFNKQLFDELNNLVVNHLSEWDLRPLYDMANLAGPLDYYLTQILTDIDNNIKNHFFKRLNRFVCTFFDKTHKTYRWQIMNDLKNNTETCTDVYKTWIDEHRKHLIPIITPGNTIYDELNENPQAFLKPMMYMISIYESKFPTESLFQFCPLTLNNVPGSIRLDTNGLAKLMGLGQVKDMINPGIKRQIWEKFFNLERFTVDSAQYNNTGLPKVVFNYAIITDGYSVSIEMMVDDQGREKYNQRIQNRIQGIKRSVKNSINSSNTVITSSSSESSHTGIIKTRPVIKPKVSQETQSIKITIKPIPIFLPISKQDETNHINQQVIDNKQIDVPVQEKKKITIKPKIVLNNESEQTPTIQMQEVQSKTFKPTITHEFPLIHEKMDDETRQRLLKANKIYIDPGKGSLLTIIDDNSKEFRFTNKHKKNESLEYIFEAFNNKMRKEYGIELLESKLSAFNTRTVSFSKFLGYIHEKDKVRQEISKYYIGDEQYVDFRREKLIKYIYTKKTYARLIQNIKKTYGDDVVIVIGNWGRNPNIKHCAPSPGIGLKRILAKHFELFEIDEFRTSMLFHETDKKCSKFYVNTEKDTTKPPVMKKVHYVLVGDSVDKKTNRPIRVCLNRDRNGVMNIRKIARSILVNGQRPLTYTRGHELPKEKKIIYENRKTKRMKKFQDKMLSPT